MHETVTTWASKRLWVSLIATSLIIFFICLLVAGLAPAAGTTTKRISGNATGGDCSSFATWDNATKTCTLTADLVAEGSNGIEIISDNVTLDGAGHSLTGSVGFTSGVALSARTGVTIKNLTVRQFRYGINILAANSNTFSGNTLENNTNGIYMTMSNSNQAYNNNFIDNTAQAVVSSGTGNVFSIPSAGGNFWSSFSTPVQGCDDNDGDFFCDAAFPFTGGEDAEAYTTPDGWKIVHPPDSTPPEITSVLPEGEIGSMAATVRVYYNDPGSNINLASVSVYLDGSSLSGCVVSQASASCDVYELAMGAHSIGGSLSDNLGNTSTFSGSFTVADNAAPSVNDIGPSGTINDSSTILSAAFSDGLGSGINAATAAVYLDDSLVAGCTATETGVDCAVSGLADGGHAIMFYVNDFSGNRGSGSASFQIDTSAPFIGAVLPSGSVDSGSVTISADYSDSGSGINAASAIVYLDGGSLSGCTATAANVSCPVSSLVPGAHSISGSVADNAGNQGDIIGSFGFVDSTAPSVSNIQPNGTLSTGSTTLKASFSDGTGSGVSSASVVVYLDGSAVSGCAVTAASASCDVYDLANGSHTVLVGVDDISGNHGTGSGSFTVDTSKPLVTPTRYIRDNPTGGDCAAVGAWDQYSKTCYLVTDLNFSKNGIVIVGNGITLDGNGHTITGAGSFTSGVSLSVVSGATIYNIKIKNFGYGVNLLLANGNTITDTTMQGNRFGAYFVNSGSNIAYRNNFIDNTTSAYISSGSGNTFDLPDPEGGNYWSTFDSPPEGCLNEDGDDFCDAAYAVYGGQDNLPRTIQIAPPADTKPPVIHGLGPSGPLASASAAVYAYYNDPASGINSASAVIYLDGVSMSGCVATTSSISCPASGITPGAHVFTVSVMDLAGNANSASSSFFADFEGPLISDVTPTGYVSTASATVYAYYSDSGSGISDASASVYMDGTKLDGCEATATRISCPNSGLAQGSHNLMVSVSDGVGNISTALVSFTFDSIAPPVSGILPAGELTTRSAAISGYYSDAIAGIDTASVEVRLDGAVMSGCAVGATGVSCNRMAIPDGVHSIDIEVKDNAGNVGGGSGTFTVASDEPLVTGIAPSGNVVSTSATIRAYYSDADSGINSATAAVYLDGTRLTGCTATVAFISCPQTSLAQGRHDILVSVSDGTGVNGAGDGSFVVDTIGPVISNILPAGEIESRNATITAYFSDAVSGVDSATAAVYLDGAKMTGCSISAAGADCPVSGLALGVHNISVTVKDKMGNIGTGTGSLTVVPAHGRPDLLITSADAYWASYLDYQQRQLMVRCSITNKNFSDAANVTITDSYGALGVTLVSEMPLAIGNLDFGTVAQFTLRYQVPVGVSWWSASFTGTAENYDTVYDYS